MANINKKYLAIGVIVIILIISYFVFTKLNQTSTYTSNNLNLATTTTSAKLAIDSDGDGLKDWEEQLWKTDPNNPDTDGDGTEDGKEIKDGRNPLVKGPNDKLDLNTVEKKINLETEQDLTDTDKFSRELFIKIIAANQSSEPPTEADFQDFFNATIKKEVDSQKARTYSAGDFTVDTAENPEKIRVYGNSLAALLKKPPAKPLEYEIAIVDRAQTNKDPKELLKLNDNIAAYEKIEDSLLKMSVPKSAVPFHIALTNATASMIWSITGLKYILTDPIKALPGVAGYGDNAENFPKTVYAFGTYFKSQNVVFRQGDDGYQFFDGL